MSGTDSLFQLAEKAHSILVDYATGKSQDEEQYQNVRRELLSKVVTREVLPSTLRTYRSLREFWGFIKPRFGHYYERREYLRQDFEPFFRWLEERPFPSDDLVDETLGKMGWEQATAIWTRALERRSSDPDGAITLARTLLETACKHILREAKVSYDDKADLPDLYGKTVQALELAPSQQAHDLLRRVCGSCFAIVQSLGELRNRLGDAHGKAPDSPQLNAHHAQLAVNVAGALASFLAGSWESNDMRAPLYRRLTTESLTAYLIWRFPEREHSDQVWRSSALKWVNCLVVDNTKGFHSNLSLASCTHQVEEHNPKVLKHASLVRRSH